VRSLARALFAAGMVRETFEAAALAREKRSPTGLPFPEIAVAMPHAEPEHVLSPGLALATLTTPVVFREMGAPQTKISVSIVVMPALSAKEQAEAGLAGLVERLQDENVRRAMVAAQTDEELARLWG